MDRNKEKTLPPEIQELLRGPFVTYFFMAVNIILFLLVEVTGGSENTQNMIRWGAVYGPRIVKYREYWRFLAAAFLHFGIAHIANNMATFYMMGFGMVNLTADVRVTDMIFSIAADFLYLIVIIILTRNTHWFDEEIGGNA